MRLSLWQKKILMFGWEEKEMVSGGCGSMGKPGLSKNGSRILPTHLSNLMKINLLIEQMKTASPLRMALGGTIGAITPIHLSASLLR